MLLLRSIGCRHALFVLFLAGCSNPNAGKVEIIGSVKLDGEPVKEGSITFEPLEGQPTGTTAVIRDGAYNIPKEGGLLPGKYQIRISAGDGKTPVNLVDAEHPPAPTGNTNIISKDLIPAAWNVDSKEERTVGTSSPQRIDFAIP